MPTSILGMLNLSGSFRALEELGKLGWELFSGWGRGLEQYSGAVSPGWLDVRSESSPLRAHLLGLGEAHCARARHTILERDTEAAVGLVQVEAVLKGKL